MLERQVVHTQEPDEHRADQGSRDHQTHPDRQQQAPSSHSRRSRRVLTLALQDRGRLQQQLFEPTRLLPDPGELDGVRREDLGPPHSQAALVLCPARYPLRGFIQSLTQATSWIASRGQYALRQCRSDAVFPAAC